jgi:hypothetical protein
VSIVQLCGNTIHANASARPRRPAAATHHHFFLRFLLISLCMSGNTDSWRNDPLTRTNQPPQGNNPFWAQIDIQIATGFFSPGRVPSGRIHPMNLNDAQKAQVAGWISQGAKLAEIQSRLASELGLKLTYMEVRFLVDDLKLVPKDPERPKTPEPAIKEQPSSPALAPEPSPLAPNPAGGVTVSVDQIARPGALVSGKVSFSDGQKAAWTLDQMGRLGLAADQKGYRPSQTDLEQFQTALQNELAKMGF